MRASSGLLSSASARDGELPECQLNWKPNGMHWAFLLKCDRNPDLLNAPWVQGTAKSCSENSERSVSAGMNMEVSVTCIINESKLVINMCSVAKSALPPSLAK